jgi:hypothetical protein
VLEKFLFISQYLNLKKLKRLEEVDLIEEDDVLISLPFYCELRGSDLHQDYSSYFLFLDHKGQLIDDVGQSELSLSSDTFFYENNVYLGESVIEAILLCQEQKKIKYILHIKEGDILEEMGNGQVATIYVVQDGLTFVERQKDFEIKLDLTGENCWVE